MQPVILMSFKSKAIRIKERICSRAQGSYSVMSNKPRLFRKKTFVYQKNRNAKRHMNANTLGKTVIKILICL